MSASKAQLLRFIARSEPLERTLATFRGVSRADIGELLEAIAATLEPTEAEEPPQPPRPPRSAAAGPPKTQRLRVYSDGAARGNPGPAGAGAVLVDIDGQVVERLGRYLGTQTNNHAEYMGLILGLEAAKELGAEEIEVYADSQLLIRQLEGKYRVKSETLRPLHTRAQRLLDGFGRVSLQHIPREENVEADEMSNRAIDERL